MAHNPEMPPPFLVLGPWRSHGYILLGNLSQAAIPHVPDTQIINGSFKENPETLYRKAIRYTLPQTWAADYLTFFLLPNNLHMKFYRPKDVKMVFICAMI